MRLSELLGVPPSNNARFIDKDGRLMHVAEGNTPLLPGGCAAKVCINGRHYCPHCNVTWIPKPNLLPPCCSMSRAEYERRTR